MKMLSVSLVKTPVKRSEAELKQQFSPLVIEKAQEFDRAAIFLRAALHKSGIAGPSIDNAFKNFGNSLGLTQFLNVMLDELELGSGFGVGLGSSVKNIEDPSHE